MKTGSRAKVMNGSSDKTSGGLTKKDLKRNKAGEIVSKKKSLSAKKKEAPQLKIWRKSVKKVSATPAFVGKFNTLKKGTPFYNKVRSEYDARVKKICDKC